MSGFGPGWDAGYARARWDIDGGDEEPPTYEQALNAYLADDEPHAVISGAEEESNPQTRLIDAFHDRTGRCLGDHLDCARVEQRHREGNHSECLPEEDLHQMLATKVNDPMSDVCANCGKTRPEILGLPKPEGDYISRIHERLQRSVLAGPLLADIAAREPSAAKPWRVIRDLSGSTWTFLLPEEVEAYQSLMHSFGLKGHTVTTQDFDNPEAAWRFSLGPPKPLPDIVAAARDKATVSCTLCGESLLFDQPGTVTGEDFQRVMSGHFRAKHVDQMTPADAAVQARLADPPPLTLEERVALLEEAVVVLTRTAHRALDIANNTSMWSEGR